MKQAMDKILGRQAYLGKTENVVNEEKHVLPFSITEVLSHSKSSKTNTSTSTWGLIHLTVDKGTLAFSLIKKKYNYSFM